MLQGAFKGAYQGSGEASLNVEMTFLHENVKAKEEGKRSAQHLMSYLRALTRNNSTEHKDSHRKHLNHGFWVSGRSPDPGYRWMACAQAVRTKHFRSKF